MLQDLKSDVHLMFTEVGGLKMTKQSIIREPTVKIHIETFEAKRKINISKNWQPIPQFGDYDYLADYTRIIKTGDFMEGISGNEPPPPDNSENNTKTRRRGWLPHYWNDIRKNN